ncbi:MAG: hypothetical protein WAO07_20705 [Desulfobacterales bacterium]
MPPAALSRRCAIGAFLLLALSACSTLNRMPTGEETAARLEAEAALAHLEQANASLSTIKGLGRIKLWGADERPQSQRAAWVAAAPDRLAIVVLAAGRPVVRVAADGRFVYLVDLQDSASSYTKKRTADASLARLIRIPITVTDIVAILAGRPPIPDHSRASLQKDGQTGLRLLVLKNRWHVVAKIYIGPGSEDLRRWEVYGANGKLTYRVEFEEMQTVQGYRVPLRLLLTDDAGNGVQLEIEQYLVNVPVTTAMFEIPPPGAASP